MITSAYKHRLFPLVILALHLALLGVVVYFMDYREKPAIEELLQTWIVRGLGLNFFLILVAALFCLRDIRRAFSGLKRLTAVWLAVITVGGILLCALMVPTEHRIYYDEDIYANIGQNIALSGKSAMCNYGTFEYGEYTPLWLMYNKEPSGWPYLVSLVFRIFGTHEEAIFRLNNIFFGGAILICFFLIRLIARDDRSALLGALAFALIPHNLIWSNTMAVEPSAMLLAGLCVLTAAAFFRDGRDRHFLLLAVLLPFASQIRPEGLLIVPIVMGAFAVFKPQLFTQRKLWMLAVLIHLFLLPHLLHLYAVSGHDWGAGGAKFSTSFFSPNLSVNAPYFTVNREFPVIVTLLSLVGLVWGTANGRWRLVMAVWFLAFWGIFLFFYAGSYHYGADDRFALLVFLPMAVLAGIGAARVIAAVGMKDRQRGRWALGVLLILIFFGTTRFFPMVRAEGQEAWAARYDHKYARQFIGQIPDRSMVVSHVPVMFLLWGHNAIQSFAAVNEPKLMDKLFERYRGHVYFHRNYWCHAEVISSNRICAEIERLYDLTPVVTAQEQDFEYGLFQMRKKAGTP
ncbi:MAG: glycosyltransferase family 39 protein [Pseudomonadota bacterium]